MSIKVNYLYVDEAYSPIVAKALWANQCLIPGITYTDKYYERAGKIYIHKEIKGTVKCRSIVEETLRHNTLKTV